MGTFEGKTAMAPPVSDIRDTVELSYRSGCESALDSKKCWTTLPRKMVQIVNLSY